MLQSQSAKQWHDGSLFALAYFFESAEKQIRNDDPQRTCNQVVVRNREPLLLLLDRHERRPRDIRLAFSIEDLVRNDSTERPARERSSLSGANDLLSRDGKEELQEVAIKIRIALFVGVLPA